MSNTEDTSWNSVAPWYDDLVTSSGSYQKEVILPNLLRLAGDVSRKKVLDLACGQGFFSHEFAQKGAEVFGVDLSRKLVQTARTKASQISFLVGSAEKLPPEIKSNSFDVVVCVLALQNIRNLDAVISEASRVLVHGGRFLVVLNHPCFRIPKRSAWGFDPVVDFGIAERDSARQRCDAKIHYGVDEQQAIQYRKLDGYLSESSADIVMHPGEKNSPKTVSFHRPLQLYFKAFSKYGLLADRMEEWISHKESEQGPRKGAEDKARNEFPLFLYIGLIKK